MMPLWRYHVPKIARHAASGHTNDYDLENQSRGRNRSSRRRCTTVPTGTGIGEPLLLNTRCNFRSAPTTIWPSICLSELIRSAHCRSMRRWTLNGYMALIRSTSLTRSYLRDLRSLGKRSHGDLEGSKRSSEIATQTPRAQRMGLRIEYAQSYW